MKGYRTIVLAVVSGVLALLETQDVLNILPDSLEKLIAPAIALLMFVMRYLTSSKVGKS